MEIKMEMGMGIYIYRLSMRKTKYRLPCQGGSVSPNDDAYMHHYPRLPTVPTIIPLFIAPYSTPIFFPSFLLSF